MENKLRAIIWEPEKNELEVLDQTRLPHESRYESIKTSDQAFDCIKEMRVRGAPAIAIVAALSLAVEIEHSKHFETARFDDLPPKAQVAFIKQSLDHLKDSRPTAVDLGNAIQRLKNAVEKELREPNPQIKMVYTKKANEIYSADLETNKRIGRYGAEYLRSFQPPEPRVIDDPNFFTTSPPNTQKADYLSYRKLSVLTHCNTGSLATSGHGTALGIIRSLHSMNYLDHAYCTETRPYNQGSRLTAYELVCEGIPSTLITDSMAGALFARKKDERNITAVIVGADRVARNGDTANKIGTYSLAVLAKHHGIKFIVAAPTTTIDLTTECGGSIEIEEREKTEMTQVSGPVIGDQSEVKRIAVGHQGIDVWNPSFDVTPGSLIDAIITEEGPVEKDSDGNFDFWKVPGLGARWEKEVGPLFRGHPTRGLDRGYAPYEKTHHGFGMEKGSHEREKSDGTTDSTQPPESDKTVSIFNFEK